MKNYRTLYALLAAVVLFAACSEDTPVADPSFGDVNPEVYVAVGNSLTAGYTNGALYESAQVYSYPNLIAQALGTSEFVQPIIPDPGTGNKMSLAALSPTPSITFNGTTLNAPANLSHTYPYHNLGLPGAVFYDALDTTDIVERGTSRMNPFYSLIMRNQQVFGKNLIEQAIRRAPTVLTFWLGNNDVLGYAASGGTRGSNTGLGGFPPLTRPTEEMAFTAMVKNAFALLAANLPNTKIVIGNIPDPVIAPFFNTVPRNIPGLSPTGEVYYVTSSNTVGTVTATDFLTLEAQAAFLQGFGSSGNPLPSRYVLDATEVEIARAAVKSYNAILATEAAKHGFALADMNALMSHINNHGYQVAGEEYTFSYISGGLFGLDGLHLTPRGNAIVANEFIAAMNRTFGANIRQVPLHTLPGILVEGAAGKTGPAWSPEMRYEPLPDWMFGLR